MVQYGGMCSPLTQLHSAGLATSHSSMKWAPLSVVSQGSVYYLQGVLSVFSTTPKSFFFLELIWCGRSSELDVPLRNTYSIWNNMYLSEMFLSDFLGKSGIFMVNFLPQQNLFCLGKLQGCISGNVKCFQIVPQKIL